MQKLKEWRQSAHTRACVHLSTGIDITTPPTAVRASFPYDILPPLRILTSKDILNELVKLPPTDFTCLGSFAYGAVCLKVLQSVWREWFGLRSYTTTLWKRLRKLLLLAGLITLFVRFMERRRVSVVDVSKSVDVSSNPSGCCCVTTRVLTISNSHAGTHADTPEHFLSPEVAQPYEDDQYTGDALLLDLSEILEEEAEKMTSSLVSTPATVGSNSNTGTGANKYAITANVLADAEDRYGVDISQTTRLIVCTTNTIPKKTPLDAQDIKDEWKPEFAHLSVDGAEYLANRGHKLLLFGIDTPSVDHPSAAPICETSHGKLWQARIAILENLDMRNMFALLASEEANRRVCGSVQTVFNSHQTFHDAKGCNVIFYPTTPSSSAASTGMGAMHSDMHELSFQQ